MAKSKILGKLGDDNYRLENVPVAMPKENMDLFRFMEGEVNHEPFNNYMQYGNAYHDDWMEKPSKVDPKYIRVMEAVQIGIQKALNEAGVGSDIDNDFKSTLTYDEAMTLRASKGRLLPEFIEKYQAEHPGSTIETIKDQGSTYICVNDNESVKKYIVIANTPKNRNLSVNNAYFNEEGLDGILFIYNGNEEFNDAGLMLDLDVIRKAYYQELKTSQKFICKYYVFNMMAGRAKPVIPDPINAPKSSFAIMYYEPMMKMAKFRGVYYDL